MFTQIPHLNHQIRNYYPGDYDKEDNLDYLEELREEFFVTGKLDVIGGTISEVWATSGDKALVSYRSGERRQTPASHYPQIDRFGKGKLQTRLNKAITLSEQRGIHSTEVNGYIKILFEGVAISSFYLSNYEKTPLLGRVLLWEGVYKWLLQELEERREAFRKTGKTRIIGRL